MSIILTARKTISDYSDVSDIIIQNTAPASPTTDTLWLDTSNGKSVLKRWTGSTWETVEDPQAIAQAQAAMELMMENERNARNELIVGTQTSTTSEWRGTSSFIPALKEGQEITYYLPQNSSSSAPVTLTLALTNGSDVTKNVYLFDGTRLNTEYTAGSSIHLVYHENLTIQNDNGTTTTITGWRVEPNPEALLMFDQPIQAKTGNTIHTKRLIVADDEGYFELGRNQTFSLNKAILWATETITGNTVSTRNYLSYPICNLQNQLNGENLEIGKTVYIVGQMLVNSFTTESSVLFTTTIPQEEDGKHYISLGYMKDAVDMYLYPQHPVFSYVGGGFSEVNASSYTALINTNTHAARLSEVKESVGKIEDDIIKIQNTEEKLAKDMNGQYETVSQRITTLSSSVDKVTISFQTYEPNLINYGKYFTFDNSGLDISASNTGYHTKITETGMIIADGEQTKASFEGDGMYIPQARITDVLSIGSNENGWYDIIMGASGVGWKWREARSVPRITRHPVDAPAQIGDTVTFKVKALNGKTYQWQYAHDLTSFDSYYGNNMLGSYGALGKRDEPKRNDFVLGIDNQYSNVPASTGSGSDSSSYSFVVDNTNKDYYFRCIVYSADGKKVTCSRPAKINLY